MRNVATGGTMSEITINAVLSLGLQLAVLGLFCLIGALLPGRVRWRWVLTALALFVAYDVALSRAFGLLPHLPPAADWNWFGKAMAVVLLLGIASLPSFGWRRVGLTWHQEGGWTLPVIVTLVAVAPLVWLNVADGIEPSDAETIAFQLTMPGLDEELFYRGVLLLALNEAFRNKLPVLGARIGWGGVITAILFGVIHGLSWDGGLSVSTEAMLWAGIPGIVLLWLRERTGSLVMPTIAHNLANGAAAVF